MVQRFVAGHGGAGVCFMINRANQSITALIMAPVDRPHMSTRDKCPLSTWGIRPNSPHIYTPDQRHNTHKIYTTIYFVCAAAAADKK